MAAHFPVTEIVPVQIWSYTLMTYFQFCKKYWYNISAWLLLPIMPMIARYSQIQRVVNEFECCDGHYKIVVYRLEDKL